MEGEKGIRVEGDDVSTLLLIHIYVPGPEKISRLKSIKITLSKGFSPTFTPPIYLMPRNKQTCWWKRSRGKEPRPLHDSLLSLPSPRNRENDISRSMLLEGETKTFFS